MQPLFQKGQTVLFQGDSITDCERNRADVFDLGPGYPAKIAAMYQAMYPDQPVTFINKGISGDRVIETLQRYDDDMRDIAPDFISILLGINDVWRRYDSSDPTTTEAFTSHYEQLLQQLKRDCPNARILIIEPFLLTTDPEKEHWHEDLDPKRVALRKLADRYADYLLPMDGLFASHTCSDYAPVELSLDGVHPTPAGHALIANAWMRLVGLL